MSFEEELELDLKARLAPLAALTTIEVVDFPANKAGIQPTVNHPRLMPIFAGEKAGEQRATDAVHQEVDIMINIWITARERHGSNGLYFAKSKAEELLLGYTPMGDRPTGNGCLKKLVQVDGLFPDIESDNWIYILTLKTSRMKVQFDETESGPILNTITYNENIS